MRRLLVVALAVMLLTACDDDDVSSPDSHGALMAQRTEVRAATSDALAALEQALPVRRAQMPGLGFQPCTSSGLETYQDFRYAVRARVDPTGAPGDLLGAAGTALADAGFDVGEPTAGTSSTVGSAVLTATRGDVTVTLTSRPSIGPWLILDAGAPCVDVAKGDSGYWLAYRDDEPLA